MKRHFILLLLVGVAMGAAASPAEAKQKAKITQLTLIVDAESVGVSFFFENGFSPKTEQILRNGVPANLTFHVKLHRSRRLWKDKTVASLEWTRRIHYDNIKEEYEIFMQETSAPIMIKDFQEAKERAARVENVWVTPVRPLSAQKIYYIRVRAELEPGRLPFSLKDLFFFIPSGKIKTDWLVQRFRVGSFVVPKTGQGASDERDTSPKETTETRKPEKKE
jgi:hypothetical protein